MSNGLVKCPKCGTVVIPRGDGKCPHCRAVVAQPLAPRESAPVQQRAEPAVAEERPAAQPPGAKLPPPSGRPTGARATRWLHVAAKIMVPAIAIGVTLLLAAAAFLRPRLLAQARAVRCRSQMQAVFFGLHSYRMTYDDFFPLGFHRSGSRSDLGDVSSYRLALQPFLMRSDTLSEGLPQLPDATPIQRRLHLSRLLWKDPSRGWTSDYFAPVLIFRGNKTKDGQELDLSNPAPYDRHCSSLEPLSVVSSFERPLLTEVNASYPDPTARDPKDAGHEQEMSKGWCTTELSGCDFFAGAGTSLRDPTDYKTARFDFRHSGYANFLFLDGRVEAVAGTAAERLRRISDAWNYLEGRPNKSPQGR